jgi:adenosylcobyric acid synthase
MSRAKVVMVQGTASSVGKSTLVTGLCRILAQDGMRVAPFKAQNMALNSFVTRSGGEIGRAQVVQAEAAGIEPTVEMNPILLKPEGHTRSQVIVMGRPLATWEAREYYRNRTGLLDIVQQALAHLQDAYDVIVIEGAGSPVELNLANHDLVNMRIARLADAPVLLVGDIDRGGIFASLLGTLMLLSPADRERVKGLIVNKFRGDMALWRDGEQLLAERSGVPVLGTLPLFKHIRIAEEDSVALEQAAARDLHSQAQGGVEIVVIRLPYLSNYDEFDALAAEPGVRLRFLSSPDEFPGSCDLIVVPGTKNTLSDLAWLWREGLAQRIRQEAKQGCAVLGICGGYQMLGERVSDPDGVESERGRVEAGLHLLEGETFFEPLAQKITRQCRVRVEPAAKRGLFANVYNHEFQAYQIHVGRTITRKNTAEGRAFFSDTTGGDGQLNADGWCAGCYLHGLFENDTFRQAILEALAQRRALSLVPATHDVRFNRQNEYDKLAQVLRENLDIQLLKSICNL